MPKLAVFLFVVIFATMHEVGMGYPWEHLFSNPCKKNPCLNGGTCLRGRGAAAGQAFCDCTDEWKGARCETKKGMGYPWEHLFSNPCKKNPCLNGGTCIAGRGAKAGQVFCDCTDEWKGARCETKRRRPAVIIPRNKCLYGDDLYTADVSFSPDGCNTCHCPPGGPAACTMMGCVRRCNPNERHSWPEVVGMSLADAVAKIRSDCPNFNVYGMPFGSPWTFDYRTNRVRIALDRNGNVNSVPRNA